MKTIAVVTSDIHFSLPNLEVATKALKAALSYAEAEDLPLIIAGDLNDTKAVIRAEVANRLIEILEPAQTPIYILTGNHDLCNNRAAEHSLNFLAPYSRIINEVYFSSVMNLWFIPYLANAQDVLAALQKIPDGSAIIMHQGFKGAKMGHYVVDDTSIHPQYVERFFVVSGHYHQKQIIGAVHYIGTPFTTSFAEANDGPKGFRVLRESEYGYELDFVPSNLRKHVVEERSIDDLARPIKGLNKDDLLWLKVSGPTDQLDALEKSHTLCQIGHENYKLDKIYTQAGLTSSDKEANHPPGEVLDAIIDSSDNSEETKHCLKELWRGLV